MAIILITVKIDVLETVRHVYRKWNLTLSLT